MTTEGKGVGGRERESVDTHTILEVRHDLISYVSMAKPNKIEMYIGLIQSHCHPK